MEKYWKGQPDTNRDSIVGASPQCIESWARESGDEGAVNHISSGEISLQYTNMDSLSGEADNEDDDDDHEQEQEKEQEKE